MKIHALVDRFASQINATLAPDINWVDNLEARMERRFPASFRSLIRRYEFAPFDLAGVSFFGNMRAAQNQDTELRFAALEPVLGNWLCARGFIAIGRPDTGDFDRICFDTNTRVSNHEYRIVRIDHESVFCSKQARVTEVLAPSFYKFIQAQVLAA
jgi:hypothetical protein